MPIPPTYLLSVLAGIRRGDEVLLVRTEYAGSKWQLPGGIVEPKEPIMTALERELREEIGLSGRVERFTGTYVREFDQCCILLFSVCLPTHATLSVDGIEVLEARYFAADQIPSNASPRTRRMVTDTLAGQSGGLILFRTPECYGDLYEVNGV
jgi:ADP-ribose pyrophosphatase YjhB (NUDIX family)